MSLTLQYKFAADNALASRKGPNPTIVRATIATYFDADGVLQIAASGEARFGHNPLTGESLGLHIEEERENLCTYSEDGNDVSWTKSGCTIDDDATIAPDGTLTMARLNSSVANERHELFNNDPTVISDEDVTVSAYLKDDGAGFGFISNYVNTTNWVTAVINLTTGEITDTDIGSGSTFIDAGAEDVGNDIWRVWIAGTNTGTAANLILGTSGTGTPSYDQGRPTWDAAAGEDIFFWGMQYEAGAFPTSYIPTVAVSVTRDIDLVKTTDVSWYNSVEGTLYVRAYIPYLTPNSAESHLVNINDGSTSDRWLHWRGSSEQARVFVAVTAGDGANLPGLVSDYVPGVFTQHASSLIVDNLESYVNGVRDGTGDQSVDMPVGISQLNIGTDQDDVSAFNGFISEIRYYDENFDLQPLEDMSLGRFPGSGASGSSGKHARVQRANDAALWYRRRKAQQEDEELMKRHRQE